MKDSSRAQGGLICVAVAILGACFLLALLQQSYWALAIPVAAIVFFAGNEVFWWGVPLILALNVAVLVALVWQTHKKLWAIDKAALAEAPDA